MLKKLFTTAAAAAAVSVPLAGAAWAAPGDNQGNDGGIGKGGIPQRAGTFADTASIPSANPGGGPITPGAIFNMAKDLSPGVSTPVAYQNFLNAFFTPISEGGLGFVSALGPPCDGSGTPCVQTQYANPVPPGLAVKVLTPGCSNGRSAITAQGAVRCAP
jgi:hypothetical protein